MRLSLLSLSATFGLGLTTSLFAGDGLWVSDFEKAKQTATADGRDLLMDFTGSDWCSWCIKLRTEVFEQDAFKAAAPKSFVLVELDYPRDKSKLSKEVIEQNEKLQKDFGISGYPTILLADASGRPFAQTGYQEGGEVEYLKHLDGLRAIRVKRDAAWKKAASAEGNAKAMLLAEGLKALNPDLAAQHYKAVIDEVAKLDPKDETGVAGVFSFKADFSAMTAKLRAGNPEMTPEAARKDLDTFLGSHPKATAEQKQEALMGLLSVCRPPKDNQFVLKLMEEVSKLAPESEMGQRAATIKDSVLKMIESAGEKPAAGDKAPPAEK